MTTSLIQNPWHVDSLQAFSYLCCPECVYRCQEETSFQAHAVQNHPKSVVLFTNIEDVVVKEEANPDTELEMKMYVEESDDLNEDIIEDTFEDPMIEPIEDPMNEPTEDPIAEQIEEEEFSCVYCKMSFTKFSEMKDHMKAEHTDSKGNYELIKCKQCQEPIEDVENLFHKFHKDQCEKCLKICKCHYCGEKFHSFKVLNNHMKVYHVDEFGNPIKVKCEHCDKVFPNVIRLRRHVTELHDKKITCKDCNKTFTRNGYRQHRLTVHVDKEKKVFKCDQCDYVSHAQKYINIHKKNKHQKVHKHVCEDCGAKFMYPYMLKKHSCGYTRQEPPKQVNCPECGQEFTALRYLVSHYRNNHGGLPPGLEDREQFICDQCSAVFLSEVSLTNHITNQHVKGREKMYCEQCNQEFKEARYFIQHYKYIHKELPSEFKGKEQFMCEQCSDFFLSKTSLYTHVKRKHSKEPLKVLHKPKPTPKQCPHCDKIVCSSRRLTEHIKNKHMDNLPYKCDMCHRSYGTMTSLRWHKKNMHERIKCDVCGQEICNEFMLKRHKASVHGILPPNSFQCEHCPMFFMKLQAKQKHVEKNHKDK